MTRRWLVLLFACFALSVSQIGAQSESTGSHLIAYIANGPCETGNEQSFCPTRIGFLDILTGEHGMIDTGAVQIEILAYSARAGQVVYLNFSDGLTLFDLDTQTQQLFDPHLFSPGIPEWSPNADFIAITGESGLTQERGLYVLSTQTGLSFPLFVNRSEMLIQSSLDIVPRWSPDGSQIAFLVSSPFPPTPVTSLLIASLDNPGSPIKLSYDVGNTRCLAWSPSGLQVAYQKSPREIEVFDWNHSPQAYPATGCVVGWNAEDSLIVRSQNINDETEFWRLDLNSGETSLLFSRGRSWLAQMSPDRQRIAYNARGADPRSPQICVFELSTRDETCFDSLNMYESGVMTWGK